jgi:hypothetical protein
MLLYAVQLLFVSRVAIQICIRFPGHFQALLVRYLVGVVWVINDWFLLDRHIGKLKERVNRIKMVVESTNFIRWWCCY